MIGPRLQIAVLVGILKFGTFKTTVVPLQTFYRNMQAFLAVFGCLIFSVPIWWPRDKRNAWLINYFSLATQTRIGNCGYSV